MQLPSTASNAPQVVQLHGIERYYAVLGDHHATIAATLHVDGPVTPFLARMPQAFANTVNKHPRMRIQQSSSHYVQALVHDRPRECRDHRATRIRQGGRGARRLQWQHIVLAEANREVDRRSHFPFRLQVLVNPKRANAFSLELFCDHYQADGGSVNVVLDSIFQEARSAPDPMASVQQLSWRDSLYDLYYSYAKWKATLAWGAAKLVTPLILKQLAAAQPSLPTASTQNDYDLFKPVVFNKSYGLWASGTKTNLDKSLAKARDRDQQVTLHGALVACIVAAFAKANKIHELGDDDPVKMLFRYAVDARTRLPDTLLTQDDVGNFTQAGELHSLGKQGIALSSRFWDVARQLKKETDDNMDNFELVVSNFFLDKYGDLANSHHNVSSTLRSLVFPRALNADVLLSNMGKYNRPLTHQVTGDDGEPCSEWKIQNYFLFCGNPGTTAAFTVWTATAGNGVDYSMMHKLEGDTAQQLFGNMVKLFESIGDIDEDETLEQVIQHVLLEK